jgi:histidine decarboxylase
MSLLAARAKTISEIQEINKDLEESEILGKLVAYCSDQASHHCTKTSIFYLMDSSSSI